MVHLGAAAIVTFFGRTRSHECGLLGYIAPHGKAANEGGNPAVRAAGVQRLRFCLESLARREPVRAYRLDSARWFLQGAYSLNCSDF